jgi:calcineurin-like phosphoesterase family protein
VNPQNVQNNLVTSLGELREFADRDCLESPEAYRATLNAVLEALDKEDGLIQLQDLPTIVIPDIHGRRGMLIDILSHYIESGLYQGQQVFELLQKGRINVVCVGDIVHSEERADWVINDNGDWTTELLNKEMVRSLGAAVIIMRLKVQYPAHFHCLRGNHDDIAGELTKDFRKFVGLKFEKDELVFNNGAPVITAGKGESILVREWILSRGDGWGPSFLDLWGQFDRALPIFAQGTYYVVSHTLPQAPLLEADIRNKQRPREVTFELTSKRGNNRKAIDKTLENLGIKNTIKRWFHGHTHISPQTNGGRYEESLDGLVIRLNNQKNYVFAYVPGSTDSRGFDPTKDVYIKLPTEERFHL